jgi:hypothetical protein
VRVEPIVLRGAPNGRIQLQQKIPLPFPISPWLGNVLPKNTKALLLE